MFDASTFSLALLHRTSYLLFSRECIGIHLMGSSNCPVCNWELDSKSPIIPNFALGAIVDEVRNKAKISQILSNVKVSI